MDVDLTHLDDTLLLQHIRQGGREAFAVLVNRYADRFYRIAYRLVSSKDDAEDIVQEAFLKLWRRPKLWDPSKGAKFNTWFYKVVINLCVDHQRKKRPLGLPQDMEMADGNPGHDVLLDDHQRQSLLDRFISDLPDRQRQALALCFYEGVSNHEAADMMGVTLKALQSSIMRAKTTLKKKVKLYFGGGSI
nr:sigma-70 family RNA polymerase sigma factor [Deltaproteobacteria bacterium]